MNFHEMIEAVITGKANKVKELTEAALAGGIDPLIILNDGLVPGMTEIGHRFQKNEVFVPELLLSARAMKTGLGELKPLLTSKKAALRGKVVMGTVKGDLHDIGKNLVCMMLEGAGFEVMDLGVDVSAERFVEIVKTEQPGVLGLSALLTTTMPMMSQVIQALDAAGLRSSVKVMVGGAPLSEQFAKKIGSDGFGSNAVEAVEIARQLMG